MLILLTRYDPPLADLRDILEITFVTTIVSAGYEVSDLDRKERKRKHNV